MNERIEKLVALTLKGDMYVKTVKTEFDDVNIGLTKTQSDVKKISKYILNQEPKITEYSCFTGMFNFDGSVIGDAFRRGGHVNTQKIMSECYLKPKENLSTMEWQHATADYKKILEKGIKGIIEDINKSFEIHKETQEQEFLNGLKFFANTFIDWSHKCSALVAEFAKTVENSAYKKNLEKLSAALLKVSENKPSSFYEAVLCIYLCFSADPDSVGTLDRYLSPFYNKDIETGDITRDEAKQYLQELFLMLQATTHITASQFTRGGDSHFCVGGYLPNGQDAFNETSKLIIESLMELPTYIPQVRLRWTNKTPREVLHYMMDCERKDPYKRIAFTNDEKRIKCYTEICGISYERAVSYTTVGCNEPVFLGAIAGSNSKGNILRCMETLFHKKPDLICNSQTFDEFYSIFEKELFSDLEAIHKYDDEYNKGRAKDINYVSSLFFYDCIENAKSLTQGGGNTAIASPTLMGLANLIDSLIVVKQFVFEEQLISMTQLIAALQSDWKGFEDIRMVILKKGKFFGNDDELSNGVARRLYQSFYNLLSGKKNAFGYQWLVGDLLGYNEHHKWFGENTKATPDGRRSGDLLKFGIGQSEGRDRNGLTALLNSLAKLDPNAIACGSTVTNISIDELLVKNDDLFEKTVDMFETYFKNGGVHFQLTYVSTEDLINAKQNSEKYGNLRVRVTGFSDYFVKLKDSIQDDIISRTTQR